MHIAIPILILIFVVIIIFVIIRSNKNEADPYNLDDVQKIGQIKTSLIEMKEDTEKLQKELNNDE